MKRLLLGFGISCVAAVLGGCPIYSTSRDYPSSGPGDVPSQCYSSSDCPPGYGCNGSSCVATLDAGGCPGGCPSGSFCKLSSGSNGHPQCAPASNDAGRSTDAAPVADATRLDGTADGPLDVSADAFTQSDAAPSDAADALAILDATYPFDAADGSAAVDAAGGVTGGPCNANADCGGPARCIDGKCAPKSLLCSDTTQCAVAGSSCVDGICEPHCSVSSPCPSGYQCDFGLAVCNVNPDPCVGSGPSTCQGGSTCVEGHCVAPCTPSEAGATCPQGQLCVNGGCIPDEAALFACRNDGQSGQLATVCAASNICIHHDCYPACDPDAGAGACSDPGAVCKSVTVAAGTYLVCATPSNLGSDCDPAAGRLCSSGVCIDGYCR